MLVQASHTIDSETSIGKLFEGLRFPEGRGIRRRHSPLGAFNRIVPTNFKSLTFLLGIYVVLRYLAGGLRALRKGTPRLRFLIPLGLIGGFVDATGAGAGDQSPHPRFSLMADSRLIA